LAPARETVSVRLLSPATTFLRVEGETSERITVDGGDISMAKTPVAFADGAAENAVKIRS